MEDMKYSVLVNGLEEVRTFTFDKAQFIAKKMWEYYNSVGYTCTVEIYKNGKPHSVVDNANCIRREFKNQ